MASDLIAGILLLPSRLLNNSEEIKKKNISFKNGFQIYLNLAHTLWKFTYEVTVGEKIFSNLFDLHHNESILLMLWNSLIYMHSVEFIATYKKGPSAHI